MTTPDPGPHQVPQLSVVVPCYNEEESLPRLVEVLGGELDSIGMTWEVILVDDGSRDRTLEMLREISATDPRFRYLSLSRNFGKESAMLAGLSWADGERVAIIDADLQHPPHLLGEMVPKLDEGYHQVIARRTRTDDPVLRTALSRTYYKLINRMIDIELEDGVGDFRVLSRPAVDALLTLGETNRFSKGLFAWIGFPTAIIDYENVSREAGETKWSMRALFNYGIDGVVSFNYRPLRISLWFGILVTMVAVGYALFVLVQAAVSGVESPGYVTLICAITGFGGLQMILLGVIGEYLGRIYAETKRRPLFLLRESSAGAATPVTLPIGQVARLPRHLHHAPPGADREDPL